MGEGFWFGNSILNSCAGAGRSSQSFYKEIRVIFWKKVIEVSPRPKANSERTNVFFSPEVMDTLKSLAAEKGTSVSGLIRMIVLEYLAEKK